MQRFVCLLLFRLSRYDAFQNLAMRVIRQLHYLQGIGSGAPAGISGEAMVIERLGTLARETPLVVFDVGANTGQFLSLLTQGLKGKSVEFHVFEPGSNAFSALQTAFGGTEHVHLNQLALGSTGGTKTLYFDKPGSTLSSLYARRMEDPELAFKASECVAVETLDEYCAKRQIDHIDFLKIDVEGHELEVLRGARMMLSRKKIALLTFEFGGTHIDSRVFVRDFFDFFSDMGSPLISRITPSGVLLPLSHYHEGLEQFCTTNYLVEFKSVE